MQISHGSECVGGPVCTEYGVESVDPPPHVPYSTVGFRRTGGGGGGGGVVNLVA